jgi:hypothetical protein
LCAGNRRLALKIPCVGAGSISGRQKADIQHPQAGPRSFPAVAVQKRPLLYGGCNSPFEAYIYVR